MRINSADSLINSSCLWFRDITRETDFIDRATEDALACRREVEDFRILIDNLPSPVWLRDESLNIRIMNRRYLNLLGLKDFKDATPENTILRDLGNATNLLELAKTARESNTPQKSRLTSYMTANSKIRNHRNAVLRFVAEDIAYCRFADGYHRL